MFIIIDKSIHIIKESKIITTYTDTTTETIWGRKIIISISYNPEEYGVPITRDGVEC